MNRRRPVRHARPTDRARNARWGAWLGGAPAVRRVALGVRPRLRALSPSPIDRGLHPDGLLERERQLDHPQHLKVPGEQRVAGRGSESLASLAGRSQSGLVLVRQSPRPTVAAPSAGRTRPPTCGCPTPRIRATGNNSRTRSLGHRPRSVCRTSTARSRCPQPCLGRPAPASDQRVNVGLRATGPSTSLCGSSRPPVPPSMARRSYMPTRHDSSCSTASRIASS